MRDDPGLHLSLTRRTLFQWAGGLGTVAALTACGAEGATGSGGSKKQSQASISGLNSIVCAAPFTIAASKFYKDNDLSVKNIHISGGTDTVRAILGQGFAGSAATISTILAYQGGAKNLRIIGGGFNAPSVVFVGKTGSGITGPEGLKGKKIGIAGSGSPVEFFANLAVTEGGYTPGTDTEIVNVGDYASVWPAVMDGLVDLGALVPPQATQLENDGDGEVAIKSADLTDRWADVSICTTAEELKSNPDGLKAWMHSVASALALIQEKPGHAAEIWGPTLDLTPEVAEAALTSVPTEAWTLDISEEYLHQPAKAAVELGLSEIEDIDGLLDTSLLESL